MKKFRKKANSGEYNWSVQFSWSEAIKPDLGVVGRHYAGPGGGCAQYVEGQVLEQVQRWNSSSPLTGHRVELMGTPFYFGYEGYFVRDVTSQSGRNESISLWCGQIPSILIAAMKQSGARVVFRQIPSSFYEMARLVLWETDILNMGHGVSQSLFGMSAGFLRMGPLMDTPEAGNLITRKIYVRREFAFLGTFTLESWLVILAAMLLISLTTSLAGRCKPTGKNKRAYKWPGQIRGGHDALFRDWPAVTLEFGGVLWGQGMSTLDRYHRGLTSLWLLACTVLVGCLSGSLRDMMSHAVQVFIPQGWDDLWSAPWRRHTLVTTTVFEVWSELRDKYGAESMDQLEAEDRLWLLPSDRVPLSGLAADPVGYLQQFINCVLSLSSHILLVYRRFFLASLWMVHVVRTLVVETLAYLYDETIQQADDQVTAVLKECFAHVAISPGASVMQVYFPFVKYVPHQVERYVSRFLWRFHENGMASLMNARTDERIESKILTQQMAKAGAEVLQMDDFIGPLLLDCTFLLCVCAVFGLEVLIRIRLERRVHITNT